MPCSTTELEIDLVIELFRGIASIMVMLSHYKDDLGQDYSVYVRGIFSLFNTGVHMFFVITGYVFARMFYSENKIAVIPFLTRRFFRIYPLYVCSLIAYLLLKLAFPEGPGAAAQPSAYLYFVRHLFFLETTRSYHEMFYFTGVYWSLPVEVEYYLLLPLLVYVHRKVSYSLVLIFIASHSFILLIRYNLTEGVFDIYRIVNGHIIGYICEFIIGIALYNLVNRYRKINKTLMFGIGMSLLAVVYWHYTMYDEKIKNSSYIFIVYFGKTICSLGYAFILYPFLSLPIRNNSLFALFSSFMGNISYGIYLFHHFSIMLVRKIYPSLGALTTFFLCLAVLLAIVIILHYICEEPLRAFGRRLSGRREPLVDYKPV
jgi:peptidoglycan/LPS O-acetylase OafA/YrhL